MPNAMMAIILTTSMYITMRSNRMKLTLIVVSLSHGTILVKIRLRIALNPLNTICPGLSSSTSDTATQWNALHSQISPSQSLERRDLESKKSTKKQALAISHNYDPFWMQKTEVDPRLAFATGKNMKFEKLFSNGVIQEGDYLAIPVNCQVDNAVHEESPLHEDNSVHEDMAILTVRLSNPSTSSPSIKRH